MTRIGQLILLGALTPSKQGDDYLVIHDRSVCSAQNDSKQGRRPRCTKAKPEELNNSDNTSLSEERPTHCKYRV